MGEMEIFGWFERDTRKIQAESEPARPTLEDGRGGIGGSEPLRSDLGDRVESERVGGDAPESLEGAESVGASVGGDKESVDMKDRVLTPIEFAAYVLGATIDTDNELYADNVKSLNEQARKTLDTYASDNNKLKELAHALYHMWGSVSSSELENEQFDKMDELINLLYKNAQ